jgi:hypothetical protein
MTKINIENGGYILTASEGFDLIALDSDNIEVGRTKSVTIPVEGTLLTWKEVFEKITESNLISEKSKRIAELEAELERLKGEN